MKRSGFILVDSGEPEASEYDDSYVFYDAADPESYRQAVDEATRRLSASAAERNGGVAPRPTGSAPVRPRTPALPRS
ncbi:MAG: hypothetical protein JXB04_01955 [Kiritimatiellae bacterium]|nr:hypothetical protein [Kiritimatiellia bacterium]